MKILSSFTDPHVIPDVYDFFSQVEHKQIFFSSDNAREENHFRNHTKTVKFKILLFVSLLHMPIISLKKTLMY